MSELVSRDFFTQSPVTCARELIGARFKVGGVGGMVVETEAYMAEGDEACHTHFRPSARTFVAENGAGTSYVVLNYGMYWLVNVLVKSEAGDGFVLLRALEPRWGVAAMRKRRAKDRLRDLCSGPGKLSMALGMNGEHHGVPISHRFQMKEGAVEIAAGPRIGISRSKTLPWRFVAVGSPHVSGP